MWCTLTKVLRTCKFSSWYHILVRREKKRCSENATFESILKHWFFFCHALHGCDIMMKICKQLKVMSKFIIKKIQNFLNVFDFFKILLFMRVHLSSSSKGYFPANQPYLFGLDASFEHFVHCCCFGSLCHSWVWNEGNDVSVKGLRKRTFSSASIGIK